jgi:hypothetical protein
MRVEVDTADITALEKQVDQLSALLTACVYRAKGKTIKLDDLVQGGVTIEQTDDSIVLTYKPGD